MLRPSGLEAHARPRLEGVEAVCAHNTAVVALDLDLPDIEGFEIIRQLRACSATPTLRCLQLASRNRIPSLA